jgi:hypothetical protein
MGLEGGARRGRVEDEEMNPMHSSRKKLVWYSPEWVDAKSRHALGQ